MSVQPLLPVVVRDRLDEMFPDAEFTPGFGVRDRPGWSPGRLALVTVLQMVENLTDHQSAGAVRDKISWKYALGLGSYEEGFDGVYRGMRAVVDSNHSVLDHRSVALRPVISDLAVEQGAGHDETPMFGSLNSWGWEAG